MLQLQLASRHPAEAGDLSACVALGCVLDLCAADVWALAVAAFVCFAGRAPWAADDAAKPVAEFASLVQRSVTAELSVPPRHPADVVATLGGSDGFASFLRACLHRDAAQRPTADELLLHSWIVGAPPRLDVEAEFERLFPATYAPPVEAPPLEPPPLAASASDCTPFGAELLAATRSAVALQPPACAAAHSSMYYVLDEQQLIDRRGDLDAVASPSDVTGSDVEEVPL